jgi:predicted Fe-S protein YdhL (DUF1289 family)
MATIYTPAQPAVIEFVAAVWLDKFPDTYNLDPRPTLSILMAESDKDDKPALKHHGYPAAALIGITNPKERIDGCADLRLEIDSLEWSRMSERQREAVIAHELLHIQVTTVPGQDTTPATDDYGRPKVKLRLHDWEVGGFSLIVDWYGDDAIEKQIVNSINDRLGQMTLPFMDAEQPGNRKAAAKA